MKLLKSKNRAYYTIFIGNIIPVIGISGLDWNIKETFIFYAIELFAYVLVLLPKIVIQIFTGFETFLNSVFVKIIKSFFRILLIFGMVYFVVAFIILIAFEFAEGSDNYQTEIFVFLKAGYLAVIFIFFQYIYNFFNDYIGLKKYKVIPEEHYNAEIWGAPIISLLVVLAIIWGLYKGGFLNSSVSQYITLFIIIAFKMTAQFFLKKRDNDIYEKCIRDEETYI